MLPQSEFPPAIGAGEFFFFIMYSFMVYHCPFINKPLVAMGTGEIFFTSMMFLMVTQSALTGEHFPTIGTGELCFVKASSFPEIIKPIRSISIS